LVDAGGASITMADQSSSSKVMRILHHRGALPAAIVLGVLLATSALQVGFYTDDFTFVAYLETPAPKHATAFNLYDFSRGRAETRALMSRGPFPWWTHPDLKLRFFRPLSSALFWIDHAAFGHDPLGYHVHALLWYALFLTGAAALYRLVLGPPLLIVCALLFALSPAHVEPLAWIASRHLLVACTPALWGLVAHVAHRERGFRPGRWLGGLGIAVGLLGGEAALGLALFWIAYEIFGLPRETPLRSKIAGAAPPIAITLVYLIAYKIGDYGSAHNAAYFEPLSDPVGFLVAAAVRIPSLLGEAFFGVPATLSTLLSPGPFVVIGIVAIALIAMSLLAVWKVVPDSERRTLRWLTAGALASLAISAGGFPGARLLLAPSLGTCALVATILVYGWKKLDMPAWLVGARRGGWIVLFAVHIVLAPLAFLAQTRMLAKFGSATEHIDASLDGILPGPGALPAHPPNVFLIASDPLASLYVGAAHAIRAPGTLSGFNALSMAHATHHVRRIDDRTLLIETDRAMLKGAFEGVFGDPKQSPWHLSDRVELDGATITVQSVREGYPTGIEVRFAVPLEDERVRVLAWQDRQLLPLDLSIGEEVAIPWIPGPTGFF
jgi:hypothetical protein